MNRARTPRTRTAPRSSSQLVFRCALLLPGLHAPNTKELISALGTPDAVVAESKGTAGRTCMTVRLRDDVLEIGLGLNPDGDPEIAAACRSAWWWPQACMTATKCEGRLDLTYAAELERTATCREATAVAMRFSEVVAKLTGNLNAKAVLWEHGTINEASAFRSMVSQASQDALPLHLWVKFTIARFDESRFRVATEGLAQFNLADMETIVATVNITHAHEQIGLLAQYLCEHGDVLENGTEIAVSETERIVVRRPEPKSNLGRQMLTLVFRG